MVRHCFALALIVSIALFAQPARAFFDPPWITPALPMAGELVSVSIHGGICDAIAEREGYPQVTQNGNAIRILEYGSHYEPGDELCIYGTGTVVAPIGAFQPGDYTLTVDLIYQHPLFGPTILNIGVVPFTVAGASAAAPVPTLSPAYLLALLLTLGLSAWRWRASSTISLTSRQ